MFSRLAKSWKSGKQISEKNNVLVRLSVKIVKESKNHNFERNCQQNNADKAQKAWNFVLGTFKAGMGQVTLSQKNSHRDQFATEDNANDGVK